MGESSFGARVRAVLPSAALFVVAAGLATDLIRPFRVGQVGFDMAASLLYFDRIVVGRHLESFISATPKPLFTVVYGLAHAVTGEWRLISWLAIGVYGLAVVLAARLAARATGPVAAGLAAVAFVGSPVLLSDVSLAYSVGWALLGWLLAGIAVTAGRPRYGVAGMSLLLATLARFETFILLSVIASSFAVGLSGRNLFRDTDILLFTISQPMRAEAGVATLATGIGRDWSTGGVIIGRARAALAPSGRELDFETGYGFALGSWRAQANAGFALDTGHTRGKTKHRTRHQHVHPNTGQEPVHQAPMHLHTRQRPQHVRLVKRRGRGFIEAGRIAQRSFHEMVEDRNCNVGEEQTANRLVDPAVMA